MVIGHDAAAGDGIHRGIDDTTTEIHLNADASDAGDGALGDDRSIITPDGGAWPTGLADLPCAMHAAVRHLAIFTDLDAKGACVRDIHTADDAVITEDDALRPVAAHILGDRARTFDMLADGRLVARFNPAPTTMNVVLNWTEELKRLVPTR